MFFVLIFLILAATTSYLFPEWSWATVLLVSFGCVATLRILLVDVHPKLTHLAG